MRIYCTQTQRDNFKPNIFLRLKAIKKIAGENRELPGSGKCTGITSAIRSYIAEL